MSNNSIDEPNECFYGSFELIFSCNNPLIRTALAGHSNEESQPTFLQI